MDVDRLARGKRSIAVDLKAERGRDLVKKLAAKSDVLIDPFRPGVLESLGLAPPELHKYDINNSHKILKASIPDM